MWSGAARKSTGGGSRSGRPGQEDRTRPCQPLGFALGLSGESDKTDGQARPATKKAWIPVCFQGFGSGCSAIRVPAFPTGSSSAASSTGSRIMDLKTMRQVAKEKLKGFCRVCPVCDGRACAGEVPGMGGTGTGKRLFRQSGGFACRAAEPAHPARRARGGHHPDPVRPEPVHAHPGRTHDRHALQPGAGPSTEDAFISAIMQGGLVDAGTLGMSGDGADDWMFGSGLDAIKAQGGKGRALHQAPAARGGD